MPTEASEVAVVAGNPAVMGRPGAAARGGEQGVQIGRLVGVGLDLLPAEAVDEEDAVAVGGRESADALFEPGYALARHEGGQQVGERSGAVLGDGRGVQGEGFGVLPGRLCHQRPVAAVASESAWAKARVPRTVSGPSPASLTRRLRSSAVELPV